MSRHGHGAGNLVKKRFRDSGLTLRDFACTGFKQFTRVALDGRRYDPTAPLARFRDSVDSHFPEIETAPSNLLGSPRHRKCSPAPAILNPHKKVRPRAGRGRMIVERRVAAPGVKNHSRTCRVALLYGRTSTKPTRPGVFPAKKMRFGLVGSISSLLGSLSASGRGNSTHSFVLGSKRAILSTWCSLTQM
jgi:hypothetical protein